MRHWSLRWFPGVAVSAAVLASGLAAAVGVEVTQSFVAPRVAGAATAALYPGQSSDDAIEGSSVVLDGANLRAGGSGEVDVGMRFGAGSSGLTQGSTILSATLGIYVYSPAYDNMQGHFTGHDVDVSLTFDSGVNTVKNRFAEETAASTAVPLIEGMPLGWNTFDVTDVVQEVVDRESWDEVALTLLYETETQQNVRFYASDNTGTECSVTDPDNSNCKPELVVEFEPPSPPATTTETYYPGQSSDDQQSRWGTGGSFNATQTYLRAEFEHFDVGVRYVTGSGSIEQGATIISATLRWYVYSAGSAGGTGTYVGHDVDTSPTFAAGDTAYHRNLAAATTATVHDDTVDWGVGWTSVDVTAIVQEIVDRPAWDGAALSFMFFKDSGSSLFARSFDNTTEDCAAPNANCVPELVVEFEAPAGPANTAPDATSLANADSLGASSCQPGAVHTWTPGTTCEISFVTTDAEGLGETGSTQIEVCFRGSSNSCDLEPDGTFDDGNGHSIATFLIAPTGPGTHSIADVGDNQSWSISSSAQSANWDQTSITWDLEVDIGDITSAASDWGFEVLVTDSSGDPDATPGAFGASVTVPTRAEVTSAGNENFGSLAAGQESGVETRSFDLRCNTGCKTQISTGDFSSGGESAAPRIVAGDPGPGEFKLRCSFTNPPPDIASAWVGGGTTDIHDGGGIAAMVDESTEGTRNLHCVLKNGNNPTGTYTGTVSITGAAS